MKFYSEDGIIDAQEALVRSNSRTNDYETREVVRNIMGSIMNSSRYGYGETTMLGNREPVTPEVIEIITKMGYWFVERVSASVLWKNRSEYAWTIIWKEPSPEHLDWYKSRGALHLPKIEK